MEEVFDKEATFSYREVGESVRYVQELRDQTQAYSAKEFLPEIRAWQEMGSS